MEEKLKATINRFAERFVLSNIALKYYRRRFAFYGIRKIGIPHRVIFEMTNRCNLNCIECPYSTLDRKEFKEIDPEIVRLVIDEYSAQIIKNNADPRSFDFMFDGMGEPTLCSNLADSISYVHNKIPEARIELFTNALELGEELSRSIIGKAKLVIFNLNAITSEGYLEVCKSPDFEKARSNIERFLNIRNELGMQSITKVMLQMTNLNRNVEDFEKYKMYWQSRISTGDTIYHKKVVHNWGAQVDVSSISPPTIQKESPPCVHPWQTININSSGNIFLCPMTVKERKESHLCIGTVTEKEPITSLYKSSMKLVDTRKMHFREKHYPADSICKNCTLPLFLSEIFYRYPKVLGGRYF